MKASLIRGTALAAGCLFPLASAARAQTFAEAGAGWNYVAPLTGGEHYTHGYNVRVSLGRHLSPGVRVRFDAFTSGFEYRVPVSLPCPSFGCSASAYPTRTIGVGGLTANWLADIDPRGIIYVIAGTGIYDAFGPQGSPKSGIRAGVAAGLGIAVPLSSGVKAIVEARYHQLVGDAAEPPWLVPITIGLRFR